MSVDKLDIKRDQDYIVHQVLAYGAWVHLLWLLKTYSRAQIQKVFIDYPSKDYTPSAFNFARSVFLDPSCPVDQSLYVKTFPRNIGP